MTDDDLDLDSSLRDSLRSARSRLEPPAQQQGELFQRVALALGAPALPGTELPGAEPGSAGAAATAAATPALVKALVVSAVVGAAVGAVALAPWSVSEPEPPPRARIERQHDAVNPVAPRMEERFTPPARAQPEAAPAREVAPARPVAPRQVEPSVASGPEPLSRGEELAHLRRAQAALRDGDAALALRLMDSLDSARTAGALSAERGVTRVLALCALGRSVEAEQAARLVLGQADAAVYRPRVAASCAKDVLLSEPSDETPAVRTQSIESSRKEQR